MAFIVHLIKSYRCWWKQKGRRNENRRRFLFELHKSPDLSLRAGSAIERSSTSFFTDGHREVRRRSNKCFSHSGICQAACLINIVYLLMILKFKCLISIAYERHSFDLHPNPWNFGTRLKVTLKLYFASLLNFAIKLSKYFGILQWSLLQIGSFKKQP